VWNIRVVTICFCWIVKRHVQTGGDAGGGGARPLAAHEELAEHQAHLTSILGFAITNPLDFWTDTPGDAGPFFDHTHNQFLVGCSFFVRRQTACSNMVWARPVALILLPDPIL
jgi:hypothetical protein